MDMSPKSWLDKLLGAAVILAVSAWLIRWSVDVLTPLMPLFIGIGLLAGGLWVSAAVIRRRRYW